MKRSVSKELRIRIESERVLTIMNGRDIIPAMIRPHRFLRLFISFAIAGALVGCSARQEIFLSSDGAGTGTVDIRIDPVFAAYLTDVSAGLGGDEDVPLFDTAAIQRAFAARPGLTLLAIDTPERSALTMEIAFTSVEEVLALEGQDLTRFIRFERTQRFRHLSAEIDRHAIEHFAGLSGIDPLVAESLLPPDPGMSRREYQDHLAWALEEYAEERSLGEVFADSRIVTAIRPPGEIIRVGGGRPTQGGVEYSTPLVEAVIAATPIRYSLVFKP